MTLAPEARSLLPMTGLTHGSRHAATCHYKCGDACAKPVPNTSDNETFREVATAALSRRALLGGGAGALALTFSGSLVTDQGAAHAAGPTAQSAGGSRLPFTAIDAVPASVDAVTVPSGYQWDTVIRWGDPILKKAPHFNANRMSAEAQLGQFGYNNDYLDVIEIDRDGQQGLLVANHEYTNEELMFPTGFDGREQIKIAMAAHGMSVVEVGRRRRGAAWGYRRNSRYNRRIHTGTEFGVDGPAAGSALLRTKADRSGKRVLGTLNNCAGGTTPWGTILSGEENFNQYFLAAGASPEESRYGLNATGDFRMWRTVDPRFDATTPDYVNEPNRHGWVVEVDPMDPKSVPVKHTALGRFKHEGAEVSVARDGRVVAYMGDDERFDYVYKFVSAKRMRGSSSAAARRHNKTLLSDGDLYVAKFTGDGLGDGISDGWGQWIPLVLDGASKVPGFSVERVLVFTRLAADAVGATKMDRPEDVQPNPVNGRIYVACTNNTDRGKVGKPGTDEPNPRVGNKDGHVVEIIEDGGFTGTTFRWNLFLICGDEASAGTYFGGYTGEVSPISCPDNVAFDSEGNLWISTDGQPGTIALCDALHKVPVSGADRGRVQQFLAVPAGAETCGPIIKDQEGSVLVAVQHPGDGGTYDAPTSRFPDYVTPGGRPGKGQFAGPRPSIVHVTRKR